MSSWKVSTAECSSMTDRVFKSKRLPTQAAKRNTCCVASGNFFNLPIIKSTTLSVMLRPSICAISHCQPIDSTSKLSHCSSYKVLRNWLRKKGFPPVLRVTNSANDWTAFCSVCKVSAISCVICSSVKGAKVIWLIVAPSCRSLSSVILKGCVALTSLSR